MIGVTIGVGLGWPEVAKVSAMKMSLMTGLECRVITDFDDRYCHPSWMKCSVLDYFPRENEFLLFDADIFPLLPWNPAKMFKDNDGAFLACGDKNNESVEDECRRYSIGFPDKYVNAGLTIFSRAHAWVWWRTAAGHPQYGRWLEQTGLNCALRDWEANGEKVVRIDRTYNTLFGYRSVSEAVKGGVVNAHLAGNCGNAERLSVVQRDLKWI